MTDLKEPSDIAALKLCMGTHGIMQAIYGLGVVFLSRSVQSNPGYVRCLLVKEYGQIITDKSPYHEYQSETQVLLQICGREDSRRTPEPRDLSSIPLKVLQVLRKCWSFEPNQRPNTERCLEGLETFVQVKIPVGLLGAQS